MISVVEGGGNAGFPMACSDHALPLTAGGAIERSNSSQTVDPRVARHTTARSSRRRATRNVGADRAAHSNFRTRRRHWSQRCRAASVPTNCGYPAIPSLTLTSIPTNKRDNRHRRQGSDLRRWSGR